MTLGSDCGEGDKKLTDDVTTSFQIQPDPLKAAANHLDGWSHTGD